jgi:hypothetical protein
VRRPEFRDPQQVVGIELPGLVAALELGLGRCEGTPSAAASFCAATASSNANPSAAS